MSPIAQSVVTILVVAAATMYLLRAAWRSYVRAVRTRRLADRERFCDPECGCGH